MSPLFGKGWSSEICPCFHARVFPAREPLPDGLVQLLLGFFRRQLWDGARSVVAACGRVRMRRHDRFQNSRLHCGAGVRPARVATQTALRQLCRTGSAHVVLASFFSDANLALNSYVSCVFQLNSATKRESCADNAEVFEQTTCAGGWGPLSPGQS